MGISPLIKRLETNTIREAFERRFHPHQSHEPQCKNLEALRPLRDGKFYYNTLWSSLRVQADSSLFLREIEPNPLEAGVDYLWGFSGRSGRSIDVWLGPEGIVDFENIRWNHLSGIGVGLTEYVRSDPGRWDGKLDLRSAWRRFYLTNLLHYLAVPYGFRSSMGLALVDRGEGEGTVYELRRERWRLQDLSDIEENKLVNVRGLLDQVKKQVAQELGEQEISDQEYVQWFAKTLGEQFALMDFFGFDHGEYENEAQLHDGNVSLACEIFDFETGRLSKNASLRYHANEKIYFTHLDLKHIWEMQLYWDLGSRSGRQAWLFTFLAMAPGFNFFKETENAYKNKIQEIKKRKINPKAEIKKFNQEKWVPFILEMRLGLRR